MAQLTIYPGNEVLPSEQPLDLAAVYTDGDVQRLVTQHVEWSAKGDHVAIEWKPGARKGVIVTRWDPPSPTTAFLPITVEASYKPEGGQPIIGRTFLYVIARGTDPDKVLYIYDENKETHLINMHVTPWTMGKLPARPAVTDVFVDNGVVAVDIDTSVVNSDRSVAKGNYGLFVATCFLLNLDSLKKT